MTSKAGLGEIMKKILSTSLVVITCLSLSACGIKSTEHLTASSQKAVSESKRQAKKARLASTKAANESKVAKKQSKSKAKAASASTIQDKATSTSNSLNSATNIERSATASSSSIANDSTTNQPNNSESVPSVTYPDESYMGCHTLTEFLDTYGVSPARYRLEHSNVTARQAIEQTPESMRSAGEGQTLTMMQRGVLDDNGKEYAH